MEAEKSTTPLPVEIVCLLPPKQKTIANGSSDLIIAKDTPVGVVCWSYACQTSSNRAGYVSKRMGGTE